MNYRREHKCETARVATKRVSFGEFRYEARKEPPNWLTQNAVRPSLRRFAFTSSLFEGLRRFGPSVSDSLSEPVALRVRKQPSWLGTHPESNPSKLSQSLFNKRCYLTTRLLSHPWSNALGKMAGEGMLIHWIHPCVKGSLPQSTRLEAAILKSGRKKDALLPRKMLEEH
jgi:hypothetical protein